MSTIHLPCWLRRDLLLPLSGALLLLSAHAGVFYQEGFNNDGEAANPKRYTTTGREVYEKARQVSELALETQDGPIYWAHNFEVSFVGVPAPTPARRAILSWNHATAAEGVTPDFLDLFESTLAWLALNKPGATICFSPGMAGPGDNVLADRLTAKGYTVITDDDAGQPLPVADAYVHTSSGDLGNPSRLTTVSKGVLTYRAPDHDDMLVSSIGTTETFSPGNATILADTHPAAGGKTGSFQVLSQGEGTFDLPGNVLPGGATIVAEFIRSVPPTAASLADVDAMVAGTKPSTQANGTATDVDFDVSSPGNWDWAAQLPGDPTGSFGTLVRGKLRVAAAGQFSFALGVDDGARLRIDTNRNGLDEADTIINEDAGGAHRAVYGDASFPEPGVYDFEIAWFNSGGGASLEFNASSIPGGNDRSAITSGTWELMSNVDGLPGNFRLDANATVTTYVPTGAPEVRTLPLLVVLEGPEDGGAVFGGGPFSGFEGTGFFGASGINKWPYPDDQTYRSLTLAPVNVAGRQNVKLTAALAASFLDFETDDFLEIWAYPNGLASTPVRLAAYSAPDAATKYFVDVANGRINQLDLNFKDVTYDVPEGSIQLVIEFRAATTWWNEIVAFDNVRLSEGAIAPPSLAVSTAANGDLILTFDGVLESASELNGEFTPVTGNPQGTYTLPKASQTGAQSFFRASN